MRVRTGRSDRRTTVVAAAIVTAVVVGGCTSSGDDDPAGPAESSDGAGPSESSGPTARTEGTERFYDQELDWGTCVGEAPTGVEEPYFVDPARCAWLRVPLDYDDPDGEVAEIGVLRRQATGSPADRVGSLVLNPGGPGGSGMLQAAIAADALAGTAVARRFDLVGFDPRGVGASRPAIDCFTDAQRDRGDDRTTLLGTSGRWTEDDTRSLVEGCARRSGGDDVLASVGTRDVARDLDVLREVLGDEGLTFAGQSYGTRLGPVYAEMFGENVRAMVLDGVVDPTQGTAERRLDLHAGFQRSFELMAADCATRPDCPLGTDPDRASQVYQDLVQPLVADPVPAGAGRTLDFYQATSGVISGLYFEEQWPAILAGIAQLEQGRGDRLLELSDAYGIRADDGEWNNQLEANFAINCMDEQRLAPGEVADLRREISDVSPFMDPGHPVAGVSRDACEHWPVRPTLGIPYAQDVEGAPESLVISVTGDPATPYDAGVRLAESLDSSLLTVRGERHTVFQAGLSPCVNRIAAAYLIDLETPGDDARCRL